MLEYADDGDVICHDERHDPPIWRHWIAYGLSCKRDVAVRRRDDGRLLELPLGIVELRPELSDRCRQEWHRLGGDLAKLRLVTSLDRAALAATCNAYALWLEASEGIAKHGAMVKSPSGYPIQSYLQSVERAC